MEPAQQQERMHVMDILRGIALLGIFIANIYYLSGYGFMSETQKSAFSTAVNDHYAYFVTTFLIEGKFYSIFSLLFGAGFGLLLTRAKQKGISFKKYYSKRLFILLGIGLIHLFIVWTGDILTLYAILGFLMIFFINADVKTLWKWSIALLLSPILFFMIIYFSGGLHPGIPLFLAIEWLQPKLFPSTEVDLFQITVSGSLLDNVKMNILGGFWRLGDLIYSSRLPRVFGMFLIGFIFIKKGIFINPEAHKKFLKKACIFGFIIGIPFSLATAVLSEKGSIYDLSNSIGIWHTITYALGVHALAIGYTTGILLLSFKTNRFLQLFAPAGRMALSNYLMQTAAGIFIFFGIGLGYAGSVGYAVTVAIAVVIFIFQVIFSHIWLSYFYYGPAEWAWRSMLLGKPQKLWIPRMTFPAQPAV